MVASDGGVFAFGDAKFAGSCPGIGGCGGSGGRGHARRDRQRLLADHQDRFGLRVRGRCVPGCPRPAVLADHVGHREPPTARDTGSSTPTARCSTTGMRRVSGALPPTPRAGSTRQPRSSPLRTERATGSATGSGKVFPSVTRPATATCRAPTSTARSSQPAGPDPLPARLTGRGDGGGGRHGDDQQAPGEGRRPRRLPAGWIMATVPASRDDDGDDVAPGAGPPGDLRDQAGHRPRVGRAPASMRVCWSPRPSTSRSVSRPTQPRPVEPWRGAAWADGGHRCSLPRCGPCSQQVVRRGLRHLPGGVRDRAISRQLFGILDKVRGVDALQSPALQDRLFEISRALLHSSRRCAHKTSTRPRRRADASASTHCGPSWGPRRRSPGHGPRGSQPDDVLDAVMGTSTRAATWHGPTSTSGGSRTSGAAGGNHGLIRLPQDSPFF